MAEGVRDQARRTYWAQPPQPVELLPKSQFIPFHQFLSLPGPFSATTPFELVNCQSPNMTTPTFFEDGEWIGLDCISYPGARIGFHPSIQRMKFKAQPVSVGLLLTASGVEAYWQGGFEFEMEGIFSPNTLQFGGRRTTKRFGPSYLTLKCVLLPCGLVGFWNQGSQGGWIWLWKADWATKASVSG